MTATNTVQFVQDTINKAKTAIYSDIAYLFKVWLNRMPSYSLRFVHTNQLSIKLIRNFHANLGGEPLSQANFIRYTADDLVYEYNHNPYLKTMFYLIWATEYRLSMKTTRKNAKAPLMTVFIGGECQRQIAFTTIKLLQNNSTEVLGNAKTDAKDFNKVVGALNFVLDACFWDILKDTHQEAGNRQDTIAYYQVSMALLHYITDEVLPQLVDHQIISEVKRQRKVFLSKRYTNAIEKQLAKANKV